MPACFRRASFRPTPRSTTSSRRVFGTVNRSPSRSTTPGARRRFPRSFQTARPLEASSSPRTRPRNEARSSAEAMEEIRALESSWRTRHAEIEARLLRAVTQEIREGEESSSGTRHGNGRDQPDRDRSRRRGGRRVRPPSRRRRADGFSRNAQRSIARFVPDSKPSPRPYSPDGTPRSRRRRSSSGAKAVPPPSAHPSW